MSFLPSLLYRRFVLKWAEASRKIVGFKPFFGVAIANPPTTNSKIATVQVRVLVVVG